MQAISDKYKASMMPKNAKASDRFTVRTEIARQVTRNVTSLSSKLCKSLIQDTLNDIYGDRKKRPLVATKAPKPAQPKAILPVEDDHDSIPPEIAEVLNDLPEP